MGTLKQAVDRVTAAKTAIGNAISAKGGTVSQGDGLEEFAADIATISMGGITVSSPSRKTMLNSVYTNNWSAMTWTGLTSFNGEYVWTDGTDIYYSSNTSQCKLDKSTYTWSAMTWTGLTNVLGGWIWTDGTDIYYSLSSNQYILDKSTHTWSAMTWTGLTSFNATNIWTDGTDIYYSSSTNQYVLDKSTAVLLTTKPYIK